MKDGEIDVDPVLVLSTVVGVIPIAPDAIKFYVFSWWLPVGSAFVAEVSREIDGDGEWQHVGDDAFWFVACAFFCRVDLDVFVWICLCWRVLVDVSAAAEAEFGGSGEVDPGFALLIEGDGVVSCGDEI